MNTELWLASAQVEGDYRVTRVIVGEAAHLRGRIIEAVERLGYQVIYDEAAIVARRGTRGLGSSGCSLDIRDYPTELIVTLKPKGATATLATFNFTVRNYYYTTRGDRATLGREADAIAALALSQPQVAACGACGTETTDDSRFCRRCGAPLALEEPAELEVLRLTAGARAAQKNVVTGALLFVGILIPAFLILWFGATPKAEKMAQMLALAGALAGLLTMLTGSWRLHRTLNPARGKSEANAEDASGEHARAIGSARATVALPPRSAQASVTEGTTELLGARAREAVPLGSRRERGDTGPIN